MRNCPVSAVGEALRSACQPKRPAVLAPPCTRTLRAGRSTLAPSGPSSESTAAAMAGPAEARRWRTRPAGSWMSWSTASPTTPPFAPVRPSAASRLLSASEAVPVRSAVRRCTAVASSTRASGSTGTAPGTLPRVRASQDWPNTRASCSTSRASPAALPSSGSVRSADTARSSRSGLEASQPRRSPRRSCTRSTREVSTPLARSKANSCSRALASTATVPVLLGGSTQRSPACTPVGGGSGVLRAWARVARPAATMAVRAWPTWLAETSPNSAVTARPARGAAGGTLAGRSSTAGSASAVSSIIACTSARPRARSSSSASSVRGGIRRCSRRSASAVGCTLNAVSETADSGVPSSTRSVTFSCACAASRAAWPAPPTATSAMSLLTSASASSTRASRAACSGVPSVLLPPSRQSPRVPSATNQSPVAAAGAANMAASRPAVLRSTSRPAGASGQTPAPIATNTVVVGTRPVRSSRSSCSSSCDAASPMRRISMPAGDSGGATMRPSPPAQRCTSAVSPASMSRPSTSARTSAATPASARSAACSAWGDRPGAPGCQARRASGAEKSTGSRPCGGNQIAMLGSASASARR